MVFSLLNHLSVRNRIWLTVAVLIGSIVAGSAIDILLLRGALWREKEHSTQQVVQSGFSVLSHFHDLQQKGVLSQAAAQAAATAAIKAMRYDGSEYFWLNDLGTPYPRMVMHPTLSALDGQVLDAAQFNRATGWRVEAGTDFARADGTKNIFALFVKVTREGGAGYVTYDWPKPLAGGGGST